MADELTEVYCRASRTTNSSLHSDDVEVQLKTYQRFFRKFKALWDMIVEDFDEDGYLFFTAKQGAMIEKHESVLTEEQSKKHQRKQQLE